MVPCSFLVILEEVAFPPGKTFSYQEMGRVVTVIYYMSLKIMQE
jgi:hypothetical protein